MDVKRFGDGGQIAILGAGSMGRLWAALLPSESCGFLPRPGSGSGLMTVPAGDLPEGSLDSGRSFSHLADPSETRCEYVLVRSASPSMATQGFGGVRQTASPNVLLTPTDTQISRPWFHSFDRIGLLLVTTKAGDTLSALEDWLPCIPNGAPVVLFQNGMGSQQTVSRRWPDRLILAASTTEGANRPQPDMLVHAGVGDTWVGPLTECASDYTEYVVHRLAQSGLRVHSEANILQRLWQKLVVNAGINAFTALLDCPNGAILQASLYQQTIDELCVEIAALLRADTGQDIAPHTLRERIEAVAKSTARNTSSMRADVNAGRKTEIDFINGYLVQCGQQHGIATPVNQMLVQRVKAI
ncbi:MAG: 2-dehydropantoate 2-reductase [Marinobacter sp.]